MSEAKDALRDELITLMRGYVPPQSLEDCKFRITMALFFVAIFAIIIKGFRDMDKDWDDFKRR